MRDDLLYYYERELSVLRRLGAEFAERYPKIAGRLQLEPNKTEDPHVERMIEAFAFLAARVHLKLEDDFPEVSEALLNVVYPHYVRPIPSMSLVEFQLNPTQGKRTTGVKIAKDSVLLSRTVNGVACRFRTCYDTTLWPLALAGAQWTTPDRLKPPVRSSDAAAALRFELRCLPDVRLDGLGMDALRLYLDGDSNLVYSLYELLSNNAVRIIVRELEGGSAAKTVTLPGSALRAVGFEADEGMLPYPRRSFLGYRLLQEYFTFPEKFLFFDLTGLEELRAAKMGGAVEVVVLIAPFERGERRAMLEAGVSDRTLRLGCSPVVNLFPQTSEPILLTQKRHEYVLVPDARRRLTTETFSIDEVVAITPDRDEPLRFEPFYSYRHAATGERGRGPLFWQAKRRPSEWRTDGGTDVWLSFVDLSGRVAYPEADAATVRLTAFNGDLPSRLPFGSEDGDFELQDGGPIKRILTRVKPTPVVQPPLGRPQLWRLISQLSLNYLSLSEEGVEALREILRLHNFSDASAGEKQIQGITSLRSAAAHARVTSEHGIGLVRGRRVELDLDEEQFAGGGAYLFTAVLERFFALYASINSFSTLVARTKQRKEVMRAWPPRAGWKALI